MNIQFSSFKFIKTDLSAINCMQINYFAKAKTVLS